MHAALAGRCAEALARRFPTAGIGLAGSVAAGRQTSASDVDLLVADEGFACDRQMVFREEGLRVNLLCVHPGRFAERIRGDAHRFAGVRLNYVLSARPLHDPRSYLAALRRSALDVLSVREARRDEVLEALRPRVASLLSALPPGGLGEAGSEALGLVADALLLRHGHTARAKAEDCPFELLAVVDPRAWAWMREVLEDGAPPAPLLGALFHHAFGAPP